VQVWLRKQLVCGLARDEAAAIESQYSVHVHLGY
jgi:hypothetical protein